MSLGRVCAVLVPSQINPSLIVLGGFFSGEWVSDVLEDGPLGRKSLSNHVRLGFLVHGDKHSTFLGHSADCEAGILSSQI